MQYFVTVETEKWIAINSEALGWLQQAGAKLSQDGDFWKALLCSMCSHFQHYLSMGVILK